MWCCVTCVCVYIINSWLIVCILFSDKLFPALGFGAKVPPDGHVSHELFLVAIFIVALFMVVLMCLVSANSVISVVMWNI